MFRANPSLERIRELWVVSGLYSERLRYAIANDIFAILLDTSKKMVFIAVLPHLWQLRHLQSWRKSCHFNEMICKNSYKII